MVKITQPKHGSWILTRGSAEKLQMQSKIKLKNMLFRKKSRVKLTQNL